MVPSVHDPGGSIGATSGWVTQAMKVMSASGMSRCSGVVHWAWLTIAARAALMSKGWSATFCTRATIHAASGVPRSTIGMP